MRNLLLLTLLLASAAVSGCNTLAGAGQDISSAGRAVSNTADDMRR
jgi:predicted small secreted protein